MKQKDNIRIRIMNSLTLTTIAIVLFCAIWGVFDKNIYQEVFRAGTMPEDLIWGSTAQDIITIFIAVTALLFTVFNILRGSFIKQVILLGCNWYFMYAYGLYVMQGQYTAHYPLYIAVFGLSIYAMIAGLTGIPQVNKAPYEKNKKLRFILSAFFIFIV